MAEVFTMRRRRQGEGISRARSFWFEWHDCPRAIAFAQRLAGRYGLEYIRVEESTPAGPLLLYRWVRGE